MGNGVEHWRHVRVSTICSFMDTDSLEKIGLSVYLSIVAIFAIYFLGSLGSVCRLYIYTAFITFSCEKLTRVSQGHAVEMTLIGVSARDRQVILAIKLQFGLYDAEGFACRFAYDCPIKNVIGYIFDAIGESVGRDRLCDFWEGWLVVTPLESFRESLVASERKVLLCDGFIIPKERDGYGEKLSPFICAPHMPYDFRSDFFVFLFRILLIKYAKGFVLQADTPETVVARMAKV